MKNPILTCFIVLLMSSAVWLPRGESRGDEKRTAKPAGFRIATFSADVTCPVGHPLLGGLRQPAKEIVDPLFACGMVLLGSGEPIVLCAVDWCEIRNSSYDRWRETLAKAAGTQRQRVLVFSLHQHDAPVTDEGAAELLAKTDLAGEMFDVKFERDCIERTAKALRDSLKQSRRITHIGIGQAKVEKIASNRRVVRADGSVTYGRGSNTGANKHYRDAPDGQIDPWLKTISFWDDEKPVAALHTFATHPMSYYGQGGVGADFVGMARRFMQKDHPSVFQIYASGCSGDITAGKYNDGNPANRPVLADRLYQAMKQAWNTTKKHPLAKVDFRSTELDLEFRPGESHTADGLEKVVAKKSETPRNRILAAMGLASRQRVASGQKIDFPCIDFGSAQIVLFPGEAWVGYQLMAQQQRPDSMVVSIGYGECWPGYIPTTQGFKDNFRDVWYWVAPGSDKRMAEALNQVLPAAKKTQEKADDAESAADFSKELPRVLPKEPAESLRAIEMRKGFRVELVAAEPLVRDPVAIDFDENGRMFVVELPLYNSYIVASFKEHASIRALDDTDGDGRYDKSVVFADELKYPTAIACWDGGLFVGDAPDLLYLKDTDGDGKADLRKLVFTGFGSDRAGEAQLNSIRWGFDNRFHLSTGLDGGDVKVATAKDGKPVSVRGRGFTFDPRDLSSFQLTSGGGQHGMSMDDWGRKFVCSNSVPAQTLMYDDRYIARNPHVKAPAAAVDIAPQGKNTKLFRISANEPWRVLRTRLRREGKFRGSDEGGKPFGFFTGATGVTIYRGDAWPDEYRGNLLVGDVANNLIYRARLETKGLEVVAHRADKDAEFFASRDMWVRPVQLANAPDGTLFVLDMYRELIEGAAFMPPEFFKHLNAMGGSDRGRILRIAPTDYRQRSQPKLSSASTAALVGLLEHPNGWHRDTASRLLYQRQDSAAIRPLRKLAAASKSPVGRMTALYSLDGLGALDADLVLAALDDPSPNVRIHALRLAEKFVVDSSAVHAKLTQMTNDQQLSVRYQLAFSLGAASGASRNAALAKLAISDGQDRWMRMAILSSLDKGAGDVFRALSGDVKYRATTHGREFLITLAKQIGAASRQNEIAAVLQTLHELPAKEKSLGEALVQALVEKQTGAARQKLLAASGGKAAEILDELLRDAKVKAIDSKQDNSQRVDAIHSLGLASLADVKPLLEELLQLQQPLPVQAAALDTLAQFNESAVADLLLKQWPSLSPQLRSRTTETLLSRPTWVASFLDAIEKGRVSRGDVEPARIELLKKHPDQKIAARVGKLFADVGLARREDVVAKYQQSLKLDGEATRGKLVFKKNCSTCHRLDETGTAIGADLKAIRDRGLSSVLLNILDPNREVKPKFLSYILSTDEGRVLTGMIIAETANTVTIQRPDGTSVTVQRAHIDELRSTGLSFMPEGLEKEVDVQAMADLLAYLNSIK